MVDFKIKYKDTKTFARCGEFKLKRGILRTPAFMPVGTHGAVRGLSSWDLQQTGPDIMLANTYHLLVRPGLETIRACGGLHSFTHWDKPILTDSGGFQIFSLTRDRKVSDKEVVFRVPESGEQIILTPESVLEAQQKWGSDIMMVLDECPSSSATPEEVQQAVRRTTHWAERSKEAYTCTDLALFPIVQGGVFLELRQKSMRSLLALENGKDPWSGIAIGGLSVGENKEDFVSTLYGMRNFLPEERPHYLMGVGTPRDIVFAVACGMDMFDCVIPSRNGRHGIVMTSQGRLNLLNEQFKQDTRPIDPACTCLTCQNHHRAFIRHMFQVGDALGGRLATIHNVHYFVQFMNDIRARIEDRTFADFSRSFLSDKKQALLGGEQNFQGYPIL